MTVSIKFETDNAAFETYWPAEVQRVLLDAAKKLCCHGPLTGKKPYGSPLLDHNGNSIGTVTLSA